MILGSLGATAMAPMDWVGAASNKGFQVRPLSVVFHTPPLTAPIRKVSGWPGIPVTARVRPPRNGPTKRHCRSWVIGAALICAGASPAPLTVSRNTQSILLKRILINIDAFSSSLCAMAKPTRRVDAEVLPGAQREAVREPHHDKSRSLPRPT